MNAYQQLYERLFRLVMARKPGESEPPECDELRRKMDALPGTDQQKTTWGTAIGTKLYREAAHA